MKKIWIIGTAGLVAVGALAVIVTVIFAFTRPVVDASEAFLSLLSEGRTAEAYASTAAGLRSVQSQASFASAVEQLGLSEYASASWRNRVIDNSEGLAEGYVTTKSGEAKPVSIRLIHENAGWKVVGVRYSGIELASVPAPPTMPDIERMVSSTLLDFNQAVLTKDFTSFYATLADVWKKETTPQNLQAVFQEFIAKSIDIGGIKDVKPAVAPIKAANNQGVLAIKGHYATQPSQVRFELEYAQEQGGWKLRGISVNVGPADGAES